MSIEKDFGHSGRSLYRSDVGSTEILSESESPQAFGLLNNREADMEPVRVPRNELDPNSEHFLVCGLPLNAEFPNGLSRAVLDDAQRSTRHYTIYSTDRGSSQVGQVDITGIGSGTGFDAELNRRWYHCGPWQALHAAAFLGPNLSPRYVIKGLWIAIHQLFRAIDC